MDALLIVSNSFYTKSLALYPGQERSWLCLIYYYHVPVVNCETAKTMATRIHGTK